MKKLLILFSAILIVSGINAQERRPVVVKVTDQKGKSMKGLDMFVYVKSDSTSIVAADGSTPVTLQALGKDVIGMVLSPDVYEFPVEGIDTLQLVFKNKNKLAGYKQKEDADIDTGYEKVALSKNTYASTLVDVAMLNAYPDIASYLQGRVAGVEVINNGGKLDLRIRGKSSIHGNTVPSVNQNKPSHSSSIEMDPTPDVGVGVSSSLTTNHSPLIIVDGSEMSDFQYVNEMIPTSMIESITVLKDGSGYGSRGSAGVLVITTKKGDSK